MGNKNGKASPPSVHSQTSEASEETFKFLTLDEVKDWLAGSAHTGKVGLTTRYIVHPDRVGEFTAAAKVQDTPKFMELISSASLDVFGDAITEHVFWSLGNADKPEAMVKYLDDEKVVKFNDATAEFLQAAPGYILYKSL